MYYAQINQATHSLFLGHPQGRSPIEEENANPDDSGK